MFSELVDEVNLNTNRGVDLVQTAQFANSTLRECQSTNGAVFDNDLKEDIITTTTDSPFIWTKPRRFRTLLALRYPNDIYPRFIKPGKKSKEQRTFFYSGPTYFALCGIDKGEMFNVAYYEFARRFKYKAVGQREAIYDDETQVFTYLPAFDTSDALREQAEDLNSNWMLLDWFDTIFTGTVAKVLKRAQDQKSGAAFAEYDSMRQTMWRSMEQSNIAAQSAGQNRQF